MAERTPATQVDCSGDIDADACCNRQFARRCKPRLTSESDRRRRSTSGFVEAGSHDGWMTLIVSNEGAPIPEHALLTLIDPLMRASLPDRSGTAAGIGLGLYVCRCSAVAHQRTIGVASIRQLTRFIFRLPCSPLEDADRHAGRGVKHPVHRGFYWKSLTLPCPAWPSWSLPDLVVETSSSPSLRAIFSLFVESGTYPPWWVEAILRYSLPAHDTCLSGTGPVRRDFEIDRGDFRIDDLGGVCDAVARHSRDALARMMDSIETELASAVSRYTLIAPRCPFQAYVHPA